MRLYLTQWFLHVPAALRRPGTAHHDRGRKAHAEPGPAEAHYAALVAAGTAALAEAGTDTWEQRGAGLQYVELHAVDTDDDPLALACALADDTWATPHLLPPRGHAPYPWRLDDQRRPWPSSRRVLRHWAAPRPTED